jgi:hypothetical protein
MVELGVLNIYEVTGGRFTLTRFERDRVSGRKLVRETFVTGQQFKAYDYEVPAGFMDLVKVVGPAPSDRPVPPPKREVPTEDRDGKVGKETTARAGSTEKKSEEAVKEAKAKVEAKAEVVEEPKPVRRKKTTAVPLTRTRRRK